MNAKLGKIFRVGALAAALVATVGAAQSLAQNAPPPLRIGINMSMTGAFADCNKPTHVGRSALGKGDQRARRPARAEGRDDLRRQ